MNAQKSEINRVYKESMVAYQAKDYKGFLEKNIQLYQWIPDNPTLLYNLACAYSLNQQKENALEILNKLILIQPNEAIITENDFSFIRDSEGFKIICDEIREANKPISTSETAFIIKERDLHAEGIAYDQKTGCFYVSSVHKRKIVCIQADGSVKDFITDKTAPELDGVMGMKIDSENRILYAVSTAYKNVKNYKEEDFGRTGLYLFDLDKGTLLDKYIYRDTEFGADDVLFSSDGEIYLSGNKEIRRIQKENHQVEVFCENDQFVSLQGIDFSPDQKKMFISDYSNGLFVLDLKTKELKSLKAPKNLRLFGIDGLYFYKESLIAIQNGLKPCQVTQFYLSQDYSEILSYRILERNNPLFGDPTLGVIKGNEFYYIANDQRTTAYDASFQPLPYEQLNDIIILKTKIDAQFKDTSK